MPVRELARHKLTEGYFEFKDLGEARVKGVSEPVRIYEVLGVGPLQLILAKTEGNPFFMEEIVQALIEEGVLTDPRRGGIAHRDVEATGRSPLPTDLHIPPTVQAVLAARIDRLPPEEKDLLQTLSVIGKEFSLSLLKQVVNKPEEELYRLRSHLQAAEFIYEQPALFPCPASRGVWENRTERTSPYSADRKDAKALLEELEGKGTIDVRKDQGEKGKRRAGAEVGWHSPLFIFC